jgi:hypothetical protein
MRKNKELTPRAPPVVMNVLIDVAVIGVTANRATS